MTDGIVLLDKPFGLSSNAALQRVKRLLGAARAGHAGTLDPLATGMLPVCLGQATKVVRRIAGRHKAYRVGLALGTSTTTGDLEGEPLARADVPLLDTATVSARLQGFVGEHEQVPPMHAAIKHNGTPLYRLARAGMTVERRPRQIELHRLTLRACRGDFLEFDVECSKGTYVRVLGEDVAASSRHRRPSGGVASPLGRAIRRRPPWSRSMSSRHGPSSGRRRAAAMVAAADSALSGLRRLDLDAPARARCARARSSIWQSRRGRHVSTTPRDSFSGWSTSMPRGHARVRRFFVEHRHPVRTPILEKIHT